MKPQNTLPPRSAHTPGPWTVGERQQASYSGHWLLIHADDGATNVGGALGTFLSDDPTHPLNVTQAANARLIAAAPDLLIACKLALQYGVRSEVSDTLHRAIARAEGGRP